MKSQKKLQKIKIKSSSGKLNWKGKDSLSEGNISIDSDKKSKHGVPPKFA